MKLIIQLLMISVLFFGQLAAWGQQANETAGSKFFIEWDRKNAEGSIDVTNGTLANLAIVEGKGKISKNNFRINGTKNARMAIQLSSATTSSGPGSTIVHVKTNQGSFSFFVRDINRNNPIYLVSPGVTVLPADDMRSFDEVKNAVAARKLSSKYDKIQKQAEASFDSAAAYTTNHAVPTWLGISRDFRIFQVTESVPGLPREANSITPRFSSSHLLLSQFSMQPATFSYNAGRGVGVQVTTTRRLEDGYLPLLHSVQVDEDVTYESTYFVSLERTPLEEPLKGTHYLVADKFSGGHMLTDEQEREAQSLIAEYRNEGEQTVMYFQCKAVNTSNTPRYAWFKTLRPGVSWAHHAKGGFDPRTGFSSFSKDSIYCISKFNGTPLPNPEMAVLLQPGEQAVFQFYFPHSPISKERAEALSNQQFETRFEECKRFWKNKLARGAQISVPEKRIDEMIKAGLLHLDLTTYGKGEGKTLAPTIGVYAPIGTESAPIIQFYCSMGWQDVAKRSINYFFEKQRPNGFMQNFGGYMVETGAVLWSLGEYYRYFHDKVYVTEVKDKLLKACDFLLDWRKQNMLENLRGKGYGMIAGKVADPEDHFHQFMLNGYAYIGLKRAAEILKDIDPAESMRIAKHAAAWKADIRQAFATSMAKSPVVPLGDGTWSTTVPPWTEMIGPRALYAKKETFFSHGTVTVSDVLLGPLYLVFCEVLDPEEESAQSMLKYHRELFYQRNSAFSQPYYSRHNWMQARLGQVKPFLKTYYNTMSALADRETYTFWEHLYQLTPHKTHEEGWFLMETRWMLYMEEGDTLQLFKTIPRAWLEHGKDIHLNKVSSYFGPLEVQVKSLVEDGYIEAKVSCNSAYKPKVVRVRLPHPDGRKASTVAGGRYDAATESIVIENFTGTATVRVSF